MQLVIVYTNDEDESEYLRYIEFLQSKNYFLKTAPEMLTVEDLQGVTGLRALRVNVAFSGSLSIDEIIQAIEERVQ